ncbi:MAG: DUF1592 domain-containing protein [Sandaracinus sp.]|nr:DUF1592 domain-containing protein [Sandaracinus sp.]
MRPVPLFGLLLCVACSGTIGSPAGGPRPTPEPERPLDPTSPLACDPSAARPIEARVWRLGRLPMVATLEGLLGLDDVEEDLELAPDPVGGTFSAEVDALRMRDAEVAALWRSAETLARRALQDGDVAVRWPCVTAPDADCAATFVEAFGRRAFRRPLTTDERTRYVALFQLAQREVDQGAQAVVQAMLQSPHLVYRSELGPEDARGVVDLTPHELADALAYFFTDAPPDEELARLADEGTLDRSFDAQVARLAADPRFEAKQRRFVRELLDLEGLAAVDKDPTLFPEFEALRTSFADELEEMLRHASADDELGLGLLFDTRRTRVDPVLAAHYGVEGETLPAERRGLLTRGAFLSAHSGFGVTSPVTRGSVIRTRILCDVIPPPPPGANTSLPEPAAGTSQREEIEAATATGSCASCHARMNDLGFAFGAYGPTGESRDVDDYGEPLVIAGTLSNTEDADGDFDDLDQLLDRLRDSDQVARCMSLQTFRFAAGRAATARDACTNAEMLEATGRADTLRFAELFLAYVSEPSFRQREVSP